VKVLLHDYGGYPFTRQLAESLVRRGYVVTYVYSITTQPIQRDGSVFTHKNFSVLGIKLSHSFQKYSFFTRRNCEIEHGQKLADIIKKVSPDVVISADSPLDSQFYALQACRSVGAKFIFWMQDAIGNATLSALKNKYLGLGAIIGGYYTQLERYLVNKSDKVIIISDDFCSLIASWGISKDRLAVIPNWAPLDMIPICPKNNPWALTHNLSDRFVFLYAGILGLKHNPSLFVDLSKAFKSIPKVAVVIVNDGAAGNWLREKKTAEHLENLVLLPFQPAEVFPQMLGSADVLISILNDEAGAYSVPSKVLSYMCAAKPLLLAVPTKNLAARMVTQNDAGLVSSPLDIASWIKNAKSLYMDPKLVIRKGRNARNYADEFFNIEQITDKFEALF
jgi:colanic acid biosynthesis glycosyl transferase WcaI